MSVDWFYFEQEMYLIYAKYQCTNVQQCNLLKNELKKLPISCLLFKKGLRIQQVARIT